MKQKILGEVLFRKSSSMWVTVLKLIDNSTYVTPLGSAKKANLFEIGNFKCPVLTHWKFHGHQIFSFATQVGALVDCQVLARSLRNLGDIAS